MAEKNLIILSPPEENEFCLLAVIGLNRPMAVERISNHYVHNTAHYVTIQAHLKNRRKYIKLKDIGLIGVSAEGRVRWSMISMG